MSPEHASEGGRARRAARGFTLIEIMAVVVIMGLLMGLVGTAVVSQIAKARVNTTRAQIEHLDAALNFYQMDNGRYPTTEQGLHALIAQPTIAPEPNNYNPSGYLKKKQLPKDGWGNPFHYEMPGTRNVDGFDLWSLGADGQPGGTDADADLGNWAEPEEDA
jgi:general secretion pathway protein G